MVETNVGLGEAIAGGTSLSGDFGSPIGRGLQIQEANEFRRYQQEQKRLAEQERLENEMAKFAEFDTSKFSNPKRAAEVQDYVKKRLPEVFMAYQSGDKLKASQIKNEILDFSNLKRIVDKTEDSVNKLSNKSLTKEPLTRIINEKGIEGVDEHNRKFPFAPIAMVDPEYGTIKPIDVPYVDYNRAFRDNIDRALSGIAKDKYAGASGTSKMFVIDKSKPEYKQARQRAIENILGDDRVLQSIMYSKDFKDFYTKKMEGMGVPLEEATSEDLDNILGDFVNELYDKNEVSTIRYQGQGSTSGGNYDATLYVNGKKNNRYVLTIDESGRTEASLPNKAETEILFEGLEGGEAKKISKPRITYVGNNNFKVEGLVDYGSGVYVPNEIVVPKSAIKAAFELTEKGLQTFFQGYEPPKPAAKTPTQKAETPKPKGAKLTFPQWKQQNPNGTAIQYKEYLKS